VATTFSVSLDSAQWTLTITLLSGAVATPVLGRLEAGPRRRATILATLAVVVAGSVLTVLPLPFAWLLAGRGARGVGLGLTALMMSVARDHLTDGRSAPTIALVLVASTIGIGVGHPLAGLLTEFSGVGVAYGLGLFVIAVALGAAWRSSRSPRCSCCAPGLPPNCAARRLWSMSGRSGTPRPPGRISRCSSAGSACVLFAAARSNLAELFAAMAVLGFGVGSFSAAMPGVILAVTPRGETSSAMSFNQVVRSVGFPWAARSAA
jgi:predicted MFS family arabinose efflux permease